jgi:transposase
LLDECPERALISRKEHVTDGAVSKWRRRFVTHRVAGLTDQPRPGAPRRLTDAAVEDLIPEYLAVTNAAPTPLVWTKTADEILASVGRYCQRISDSGH